MVKAWIEGEGKPTLISVVISALALVLSLLKIFLGPLDPAWIAICLCGIPIIVGAIAAIIREGDITADLLVSLAIVASLGIREFFAAGEVALIMQLGALLEDYTAGKARAGIQELVKLTPQTAHVLRGGQLEDLPAEAVQVGDCLRVLPGETIPVDGTILEGMTSIDTSVMTGESLPVDKGVGDAVVSGTINQLGAISLRVDKACHDSSLQRMIRLAEQAEADKAPIVSLADRWASWLVLIVLACALVTWWVTGEFIRAVTVLVVFCPCSFILATPTAIMAGLGNAARQGILLRSGDALERLSRITRIAFDKTGTLTYGRPEVTGILPTGPYTATDLLTLAGLAEQNSEHPLGKAIVKAYQAQGGQLEAVSDFHMRPGHGIEAQVRGHAVRAERYDPRTFAAGPDAGTAGKACADAAQVMQSAEADPTALQNEQIAAAHCAAIPARAQAWLDQGATLISLFVDGQAAGLIALSDQIREDAAPTIAQLQAAGLTPVLLTGDNEGSARAMARQAGIQEVHANMLPEDKLAAIKASTARGEAMAMVGDGVNDALALTSAFAGIAMGGIGSDIAVEAADAVLVHDDLKQLPYLFRLTHRVMAKIQQNIVVSMAINLLAVILSTLGILTPITGALWHNFGSVFVVVNAALLLKPEKDEI